MTISRNESTADRVVRLAVAVAVFAVALTGVVAAPWTYVLGAIAVVLAFTAITGFCAIYALFGLSTRATR